MSLPKMIVRMVKEKLSETTHLSDLKHPLAANDPKAVTCIKFVRLEYLEEKMVSPMPRNQDLPESAFGKLHGKVGRSSWQLHATPHAKYGEGTLELAV